MNCSFHPLPRTHRSGTRPSSVGTQEHSSQVPQELSREFPAGKTSPGTFLERPSLPPGRVCFSGSPGDDPGSCGSSAPRAMDGRAPGDPRGLWGAPPAGTLLVPGRVSPGAPLPLHLGD